MPLHSLLSCRTVDGYWSPGIRACAYPVGTLMGPCRHPELTRKCPGTWVGLRIDPGVRNAPHSRWYRIREPLAAIARSGSALRPGAGRQILTRSVPCGPARHGRSYRAVGCAPSLRDSKSRFNPLHGASSYRCSLDRGRPLTASAGAVSNWMLFDSGPAIDYDPVSDPAGAEGSFEQVPASERCAVLPFAVL